MLIPNKFNGYHNGTRQLHISSGGGGGGGQTTSTVQNTNIPEYAQQYVENMLGATQEQLFTGTRGPSTTNPETGEVTQGNFQIEGFKPYQAYGGTYDQNKTLADGTPNPNYGKQLTYDPTKGIAGFTPAQLAAQQNIAGQYDPVTGKLALGPDGKPINAGLQMPAGFSDASTGLKNLIGQGSAYTAPSNLGYTAQGYTASEAAAIEAKAAQLGVAPSVAAAQLGIAPTATAAQSTYAPKLQNYQMGGPEKVATRSFTDAGTAESYMNPYTRNVLDIQNKELERQAGIASTQRGAQAARAGAFGGSRQGIENAEANRNLAMMKNMNQAQGMQQAYQQAQQQFNAEQGYGLQGQIANQQAGLTVGQQNLGANLGVQQLGTQTGTQMALANLSNEQQTALANQALKGQYGLTQGQLSQQANLANQSMLGQYGLTQGQFGQQANMQTSAQAQNAALTNAAAKNAASQFGAAAANQAAQFEAGQKLASAQTAAQYGLAADQLGLQASSQLGSLANQELAAKQGILGMQSTVGAQQQALDQAAKNQAIQDYANTQQYPLMQLGTMSNMLRGLPMQASTTNQYQAAPNPVSQAVGTIGAGASIYNAMKPGGAAGGLPSEFKYAKGGIMSYDMGGEVESQLESMDEKGLEAQARESTSPSIRKMAQRILRERQMSNKPQGTGPMGVQYQAAQPEMPSLRGGGIIAFQQGGGAKPYYGPSSENDGGEDRARIGMEERLAMPPTTEGGIMGAITQPTTQVPIAPAGPSPDVVKEAMRQRDLNTVQANRSTADVIKEIQAERDASGIGDNKAREEYRSQQMAERANMKDEQERQRHMRLAEFFASWGSTPGPTLVAGMNALKQSIPGLITDQKEAKKARKEADKIIYDIDESTRLDKLGMHNEATARREKAAKQAEEYNKYLLTFQSARESDERALKQTTMSTEAQLEAARIQAGAQRGATSQRAKETEMYNIERSLEISRNRLAKVEQDITNTRDKPPKGTPLAKAIESVNRYNSQLAKYDGDASKVDPYIKKDAEQQQAIVNRFEADAKRRLKDARDQVNMYEETYLTQGRGAKLDKTASSSKADPYDIMDILKSEPPASAASAPATAGNTTTKLANKPTKTTTEVPTNTLASNPYRETGRGKTGVDQGALQRDLQEYNELKDSKLSVAAGRRAFLEKKLRAAGALED